MLKALLFTVVIIIIISCTRKNGAQQNIESFTSHAISNTEDLDVLLEQIGDARIVLLGEASHGTSEYYKWRTEISKRLIQEK